MSRSSSGDWISLSISIGQLERMLGTKYHVYKHSSTQSTVIRTTSYSIPSILYDHITVITPSTYFGSPKPLRQTSFIQTLSTLGNALNDAISIATDGPPITASCDDRITPSCLDALYNISYTPVSTNTNSFGVVGYLDEFATHADLKVIPKSSSYIFLG